MQFQWSIARIVSQWAGVPVSAVTEDEKAKLLRLEGELHKSIIGQDEAVDRRGIEHIGGEGYVRTIVEVE